MPSRCSQRSKPGKGGTAWMHIEAPANSTQPYKVLESSLPIPPSLLEIRASCAESLDPLHPEQPASPGSHRLHATIQLQRPLISSSACKIPLAGVGSSVAGGGIDWGEFSVFVDSRGLWPGPERPGWLRLHDFHGSWPPQWLRSSAFGASAPTPWLRLSARRPSSLARSTANLADGFVSSFFSVTSQ